MVTRDSFLLGSLLDKIDVLENRIRELEVELFNLQVDKILESKGETIEQE